MDIKLIHDAFNARKAVRIHDDIILYVKKSPGRLYVQNGQNKIILDKELTENELNNPVKFYENLVIRAAFSWHAPVDKGKNLFDILQSFPEEIENIPIPIMIDELKSFNLVTNPYLTRNFVIDQPELSPINMLGSEDGTLLMRVFGKYSDILSQDGVQECSLLARIYDLLDKEGRNAQVLHI